MNPLSKGVQNKFVLDTCMDNIKSNDSGNSFLILDEYLGWFLTLEILCLLIVTKTIARNDKSKQICRTFTELVQKIANAEQNDIEMEQDGYSINLEYLLNKYNIYVKKLKESSHLKQMQKFNCMVCIFLSIAFFALGKTNNQFRDCYSTN